MNPLYIFATTDALIALIRGALFLLIILEAYLSSTAIATAIAAQA